jgi:Fe2+ or Zn2+ uptake regulation protein
MTVAGRTRHLAQRLKNAGLRVTSPRIAILDIIEDDITHPTAEQLLERLQPDHPSLALSTVYNTLESFLRVGLCRRVVGDGTRLRIDGTADSHDHALCQGCGMIFDVGRNLYHLPPPPSLLPHGLAVIGVRIEYDVLCHDCRPDGSQIEAGRSDPANSRPIAKDNTCNAREV